MKKIILSILFIVSVVMISVCVTSIRNYDTLNIISDNRDSTLVKSGNTYANVRTGPTADSISNGSGMSVGQTKSGITYTIYRAFFYFDTSPIPQYAKITNATFRYVSVCSYTELPFNITIQRNVTGAKPSLPLVVGDWLRTYYTGNGGQSYIPTSGVYISNNYFNDSIKTWINKNGFTKFCLKSDRDINGNQPTGQQYSIIFSSTFPTVSYRPYMNVTYYTIEMLNHSNTIVFNNISFCFMKDNSINFSIERYSAISHLMNTSIYLNGSLLYTKNNFGNGTVFLNILEYANLTTDKQYYISVNCSDVDSYLNVTYTFTKLTIFSDCNDEYIYLGSTLSLDNSQFFLALLIALWSYFIYLFYEHKENIFSFCIIGTGIPLGIILSGVAYYNSFPFGYLITFMVILISFLIPTYGIYKKGKEKRKNS